MSAVLEIVACALVCFRLFSRAAFASAAGAGSGGARVEQVDLDLTGADRDCQSASDADPAAPSAPLEDLSVSEIAVPVSLLPQALGSPPAEQDRFRKEVHRSPLSVCASSAAPGTVRTDEATLRAIAEGDGRSQSLSVPD